MEAKAKEHEQKAAADRGEEALKHTIAAAELYMQAAHKAKSKEDRARLSRKCNEMITLAERLKLVAANPDPPGPKSTRELSTAEKTIILRSSRIHGKTFPPWEYPPGPDVFAKGGDEELYADPSAYTFSPSQKGLFDGWKRPLELMAGTEDADPEKLAENLMRATPDSDLVQDMVTDCSVVASLSAAMRHLYPGKGSLLKSLIYPFDHESCMPALSKSGKYVFRMHFNGCFRQVVIDDRLPSSSSPSRTLFVVDRGNPRLIWPALMEKAYLKIRGGYDFPGSNSGTDLYVLTGWIPEQLHLHHDESDLGQTWSTMRSSYDKGDVVATLGTPNLSAEEEASLGLVSEHDYAIMDLKEEAGVRLLLVKNPWRNSVVWKGVGSSTSVKSDDETTGTFWISFEDVVQNFDSLYLNWNPAMFSHRQDHHFTWEIPPKTVFSALSHNPQYTLKTSSSSPVWILLSRHWQDDELDMLRDGPAHDHNRTAPRSLASVSKALGFMALQVYTTTSPPGSRVLLSDRSPLHSGPLVDSPHALLRLDSPTPNKPYTIVITQSGLPLQKYTFTLSILSHNPLSITPSKDPFPHNQSISSSWNRRTAGGNPRSGTYNTNPSWSIIIPSPTRLSLLLTTSSLDIPVHISLSYPPSSIQGPSTPSRRDTLLAASEYRRGAAHAISTNPIPAGTYVIVASTFMPGQVAPFVLRIGSDIPLTATPIAGAEAGRLRTSTPHLVLEQRHTVYRAPVRVGRLSRLSARARWTTGNSRQCPIRVSLEVGRGPHRTVLAVVPRVEGEFSGAAVGLRTEEVDVDPRVVREGGGLWCVVETMGGGGGCGLVVEVLSDNGVEVGGWEGGEEH